MSLISVKNLTFAYDGSHTNVFENVSVQLDTDWRLGLTARNGRGKTTLLKLLCHEYEYHGTISSSATFEYFPYKISSPCQTALSAAQELCPDLEYWQLVRELSKLDMNEDALYRPFGTLSGGEGAKLMLAAMFLRKNSFLLLDEPTNHLDITGRAILGKYLNSKKSFILVSHDRAFLDACTDHTMAINKTDIEVINGNFSVWYANKQQKERFESAQNDKLERSIRRLEQTARQKSAWSNSLEKTKFDNKISGLRPDRGFIGHKSAKMMSKAKSLEKRKQKELDEKLKLKKNTESMAELKLNALPYFANNLVTLHDVAIIYDRPVCENISLSISPGDRIVLKGKNGAGKSGILKLICGMDIPHSGVVKIGSGLKISYVMQDTSSLHGSLPDYAGEQNIDKSLFFAILNKLDFSKEQYDKELQNLSDGQKKKVLIAKSLCDKAHLYVWDEPLNYIDVISRIQIENLILKYKPTMIFAEHDKTFCDKIAGKACLIRDDSCNKP